MSAGATGQDATAQAVVDTYGNVVGLKVVDAGRYFFGSSSSGFVPLTLKKPKYFLIMVKRLRRQFYGKKIPVIPDLIELLDLNCLKKQ